MFLAFFSWWYGEGFMLQAKHVIRRIDSLLDFFSFSLLLRTLFSPYRQISAGRVDGPLGIQFRAMIDRFVSRMIGAMVRIAVLVAGIGALVVGAVGGIVHLALWPLMPLAPVLGIIAWSWRWMPWT